MGRCPAALPRSRIPAAPGDGARRLPSPRGLAVILALAIGAAAVPAQAVLVASGTPGERTIELRECSSGAVTASTTLDSPLSATPILDRERALVHAATVDGALHALEGKTLSEHARATLGFVATVLAVAPGDAGFLLAGGRGEHPVSARSPTTLVELHRYRQADADEVSSILTIGARQRFVVGFSGQALLWEIAWNPDAPAVLLGLVHDYRMGEAVPLPGRLTARPFKVASGTRRLIAGPSSFEVLRIDTDGRAGVVDLNVRREIERLPPVTEAPASSPDATRIAPWRSDPARGWILATPGSPEIALFEAGRWQLRPLVAAPGAVLAITGDDRTDGSLVAHRDKGSILVSRLSGSTLTPVWTAPTGLPGPVSLQDHPGCTVLVDHLGRWLAGFVRAGTGSTVSR